jgi:hypothetical protein
MYTHARQFPHLRDLDDAAIRDVARRAMHRRPHLIRILKVRRTAVLVGMVASIALLTWLTELKFGASMMVVGAAFSLFVLVWNLIWVNSVLFRITQEDVKQAVD